MKPEQEIAIQGRVRIVGAAGPRTKLIVRYSQKTPLDLFLHINTQGTHWRTITVARHLLRQGITRAVSDATTMVSPVSEGVIHLATTDSGEANASFAVHIERLPLEAILAESDKLVAPDAEADHIQWDELIAKLLDTEHQ